MSATEELLGAIIADNALVVEDIVSVVFSLTKDLDAQFPAVAARKIGWDLVPMLCSNELDVPGAIQKCLRVLVTINTDKKQSEIKHQYLREAKVLRPDLLR